MPEPEGKNIFSQIGRLSGPLILITAIAPPSPVAGAHMVSDVLNIFLNASFDKVRKHINTGYRLWATGYLCLIFSFCFISGIIIDVGIMVYL